MAYPVVVENPLRTSAAPPAVLLVDDHTLFREALVSYIQRAEPGALVTTARDLFESRNLLASGRHYDLALMDWKMPGVSGLSDLTGLAHAYPKTRFALMSGVVEDHEAEAALAAGLWGFFPKTLSGKALVEGIRTIIGGKRFIPYLPNSKTLQPSHYADGYFFRAPSRLAEAGTGRTYVPNNVVPLTDREQSVLEHLARGRKNAEIADSLGIQMVTVKLHVRNICRKIGVRNRTEAALKAREIGLVHDG